MKQPPDRETVIREARFFLALPDPSTRVAARKLGLDHTTLWRHLTLYLRDVNPEDYRRVRAILDSNYHNKNLSVDKS